MPNKAKATAAPRAARGAVKREVAELLASDPQRAWRFEEVAEALPHLNPGSVQSCLSDLHRTEGSPVHRVAAGTYTWKGDDEFTRKVRRIADPTVPLGHVAPLAVGDVLEVIGFLPRSKMLVVGCDDRLWVLSTPTRGNLLGVIPKG